MITITKERLRTIQQWRETYGPGSNVVLPAEEAEELARIALASLEAEPVKRGNSDQMHRVCLEANRYLDKYEAMPKEVNKLLGCTALPAPVVQEEKPMPNPLSMYVVDAVAVIAEVRGWNACRASMLQGKGESGKQVCELTMLVKQLVSQLKKAKPDCKLPGKAMDYLKRNGLISVEDVLR
ncbi:hypothetical protein MKI77_005330 [Escherichia coli]|nr:hypothetical protein [Escherichia coli]